MHIEQFHGPKIRFSLQHVTWTDHNMFDKIYMFILWILSSGVVCDFIYNAERCEIQTRVDTGRVCGVVRHAENGAPYASFLGIPYAKQPLGERRFQELQPAEPWYHLLNATIEGPICPQHDIDFGRLVTPYRGMSEACIYGNVHVPLRPYREQWNKEQGLPILVFVPGGGFLAGSGDTDLYGPETLLTGEDVIVITFNYRINVFGFLSLNTPKIPGNQGLRDVLTFLHWVKRNAQAFGGDPDNVTLMGQSAGSAVAHLVALSKQSDGLFKRLILLSGTALPSFFTLSPLYAKLVATIFLSQLGINSTNLDTVHDQLVQIPLENILKANSIVQYIGGLISFTPVIETPFAGVNRVVDDGPLNLVKRGRDKNYPTIIGFTSVECEYFGPRLESIDMIGRIEANPLLLLSPAISFSLPPNVALQLAEKVRNRYFHRKLSLERYKPVCTDTFFKYPAFRLARLRTAIPESAPVYLYQFSYNAELSAIKKAFYIDYYGAAHIEDLTYVFRTNSLLGTNGRLPPRDQEMKEWMRMFIVNFVKYGSPTHKEHHSSPWPEVHNEILNYQRIDQPGVFSNSPPTEEQRDMIDFFDMIELRSTNYTLEFGDVTESSMDVAQLAANMSSLVDATRRIQYYVTFKKEYH